MSDWNEKIEEYNKSAHGFSRIAIRAELRVILLLLIRAKTARLRLPGNEQS